MPSGTTQCVLEPGRAGPKVDGSQMHRPECGFHQADSDRLGGLDQGSPTIAVGEVGPSPLRLGRQPPGIPVNRTVLLTR
jgi:hypothetical protein